MTWGLLLIVSLAVSKVYLAWLDGDMLPEGGAERAMGCAELGPEAAHQLVGLDGVLHGLTGACFQCSASSTWGGTSTGIRRNHGSYLP